MSVHLLMLFFQYRYLESNTAMCNLCKENKLILMSIKVQEKLITNLSHKDKGLKRKKQFVLPFIAISYSVT